MLGVAASVLLTCTVEGEERMPYYFDLREGGSVVRFHDEEMPASFNSEYASWAMATGDGEETTFTVDRRSMRLSVARHVAGDPSAVIGRVQGGECKLGNRAF